MWSGFATWADVAQDSLIHGAQLAFALTGVCLIISYGVGSLIGMYRAAVQA